MKISEVEPVISAPPAIDASVMGVSKLPPLLPGEDPLRIFRFEGLEFLGNITAPVNDPEDWELD